MRRGAGLAVGPLLPSAVAWAGIARLLPEAGLWVPLGGLLALRAAALLALRRGDRGVLPRRVASAVWVAAIGALTWALLQGGHGMAPVAVLVTAVNAVACLWCLGPQTSVSRVLLLLASAVQAIAVAQARPDAAGLVFVLLYAASVAPALVALERAGWGAAHGGAERGVRRVEATTRRALGFGVLAGVAVRLLAIGAPAGALACAAAVLWAQSSGEAGDEDRGGSVMPRPMFDVDRDVVTGVAPGASLRITDVTPREDSVLAVRMPGGVLESRAALYLRSGVYDRFAGDEWTTTVSPTRRRHDGDDGRFDEWIALSDREPSGKPMRVRELRGGRHLHLPPGADAVRFDGAGRRFSVALDDRTVRVAPALEGGDAYEVLWRDTRPDRDALLSARSDRSVAPYAALVAVPPDVERLLALARAVVGREERPAARAELLAEHLRTAYAYAEGGKPRRRSASPVHDFLFRTRRGNCQHFASSMVLLLRALGHPARLVVGFRVDEEAWLPFRGEYLVRADHAHAWVEAWFEGAGWVSYDPTSPVRRGRAGGAGDEAEDEEEDPGSRRDLADRLIRPDDADRRAALERIGEILAAVPWGWVALGTVALALVLAARRRGGSAAELAAPVRGSGPASDAYRRALSAYEREGVRRRRAETPSEFLVAAARAVPDAAEPFGRLTRRFEAERYGEAPPDRASGEAEAAAVVAAVRGARDRRREAGAAAR